MRLPLPTAAARGSVAATAMLTLPAWRLGPDSSGLLIVRVDPSLGLSLLQVENWLGFGTPRVVAKFALEGATVPPYWRCPKPD